MSVFGIDHAWGLPSTSALQAARVKFVVRYLSHDAGKNLTRAEADLRSAAGINLAVIWETTASRAMSGHAGGVADAIEAAKQAKACGMPDDRPIYFAVDWDATSAQQPTINAYLDGAASVLGRARVGLYAGYGPIFRAFDAKKITYGWQTYAWSKGRWDSRAQLQQYLNGQRVGGVDCDFCRAVKDDFGQWRVGVTPTPPTPQQEDDMLGQLANGKDAVTPISWPRGKCHAIGFFADTGLATADPVKLRVAYETAPGKFAVKHIVVDSSKGKTVVNFGADAAAVDAVSVQREDDGAVPVSWDAS